MSIDEAESELLSWTDVIAVHLPALKVSHRQREKMRRVPRYSTLNAFRPQRPTRAPSAEKALTILEVAVSNEDHDGECPRRVCNNVIAAAALSTDHHEPL